MKRDEIITAAMHLFAEHGYEGTTLNDIAKKVEIKKPSLYAHFVNKEDLFLQVFQSVLGEHVLQTEKVLAQLPNLSIQDQLFHILEQVCTYYHRTNPSKITFLKRIMLFPPPSMQGQLRVSFLAIEQKLTMKLETLFQTGIDQGLIRKLPITSLLAGYYCLLDGLFLQIFYYGQEHFEQRLPEVWSLFWQGIGK
ncbi:transcriptional regulator, TetR family [Seinonella peptonophila]|uniref:Transcriptional regulator, TetR family n=1 Tax=Seinonella peptonophila TaxID=112248 RepID=A0A1M5AII6_9BACL|nr:TetR/AcrR family transcriptional regulator [Seinonella peptonophila]SHF29955.1 transcriptional regulator, TetR family [Seinonella peptonophila]